MDTPLVHVRTGRLHGRDRRLRVKARRRVAPSPHAAVSVVNQLQVE
ncbi:hypothetical protein [Phytoactinopolyspora endophytica]|nr:hypothetical protein [Phytoactinopolyspora endophytica]